MPALHYRLTTACAASLSLLVSGCASAPPGGKAAAADTAPGMTRPAVPVADQSDGMNTDATIWTVLGLARKPSQKEPGPKTGSTVSPIAWQAALDTLNFVKFSSEDPLTGMLVTDWYSPKDKPNERFRITVFVLSRELRSDTVAVTVDRQQLSPTGQWVPTTIARKVEGDLETAILRRAGQLKREWMKEYAAE
ncbi:MAG TPA: DUF3576 domain-containing protein [Stellaceae bacterium]|nr:DUF3576 domain-containing protein [Stellaceae bacterium]